MQTFESVARNPIVRAVAVTGVWFALGATVKYLGQLEDPWAVAAVDFIVNLRLMLAASPLYALIPRPKDIE